MARTSTTNHGLSRATDASADTFDFTLDHANLLDRLDAALRGVGASVAGGNLVNGNGNNAGKALSAQGDAYRGRVLGTTAGHDAYFIYQDNAGGTGADKYAVGYDDSADTLALTYVGGGASLGANGLYVDPNGHVLTAVGSDLGIRGRRIQSFHLSVRNNGGVIEHVFGAVGSESAALNLVGRITGATNTWTPTPQSTSPFAGGCALLSGANHALLLHTPVMSSSDHAGCVSVVYSDVGVTPIVDIWIGSVTVNGVEQVRLNFVFYLNSGAVWALNTSNIAAGKKIKIAFIGTI
jgi:hypothetical protein